MPIRVLPEQVASQIAAGEVVERPSSVVKELVENSIDAGARDVQVETRAGGKRFIRVSDDGDGVPAAEVEIAFHRHATSKLVTAEDLARITTLGFRGEALASIAAVSRVTFVTRSADEPMGTLLRVEGGQVTALQESGRPPGTSVTVEDLFFNVPARRKFLRTERTERRHIDAWLTRYGLAYPGLRVTLSHDGRTVFQSPGNDRLRDVMIAVYGLEVGAAVLQIVPEEPPPEVRVSGFVSPPALHRANRSYITLFVNGRWVQDAGLTYAVIQAYHTLLPSGRYPLAVVMVDLPPADVDVNVHPAKSEVRFRDGDAVFRAVQKAVRRTLLQRSPVPITPSAPPATWPTETSAASQRREQLAHLRPRQSDRQFQFEQRPAVGAPGESVLAAATERLPPLRVVGQIGGTYVVAEGPEGLYLIDQHAAHERVLFERLLAERERAEVVSQALLNPQSVDLSPEAAGMLEEHRETLDSLGFEIEPFGGATVLVRALPALVAEQNSDPLQVLEDVAAALVVGDAPLSGRVEEAVARQVCKRFAIKAGQVMTTAEMEELIRALEGCTNPRTCPHGRPTMIHLSVAQLAREFGR
ncbi:MAG TPA: DNA mismatch repair endonuclease MutL [Chloroflexi bacterium]|nr:DNA mismatch repair endonuclease MutL [Chloroflexota bacterium]